MDTRRDHPPIADDRRREQGDDNADATLDPKRQALMSEISARLRRVCQHLTHEEFERLVADMADTKLRFATIEARTWPGASAKRSVQGDDRAP